MIHIARAVLSQLAVTREHKHRHVRVGQHSELMCLFEQTGLALDVGGHSISLALDRLNFDFLAPHGDRRAKSVKRYKLGSLQQGDGCTVDSSELVNDARSVPRVELLR